VENRDVVGLRLFVTADTGDPITGSNSVSERP
jgi:hypothetical protein